MQPQQKFLQGCSCTTYLYLILRCRRNNIIACRNPNSIYNGLYWWKKMQRQIVQFVAAYWFKSNKCEDHLVNHTSNLVQRFVVNQVQFQSCLHGSSQQHFLHTNTCYFEVKTLYNWNDVCLHVSLALRFLISSWIHWYWVQGFIL